MSLQKKNRKLKTWSSSPKGNGLMVRHTMTVMIFLIITTFSCNRKPFVEHKLKFEKISDNCENLKPSFRMVSNIGGERYEFEKCLAAGFSKEHMNVSREGDTVLVQFQKPAQQTGLYKITLDIDSYPRYNFITVDEETYTVIPSN